MNQKQHTAVRVDEALLKRIEAVRSQLSTEWNPASVSAALRQLIGLGLPILEDEAKRWRARRRKGR